MLYEVITNRKKVFAIRRALKPSGRALVSVPAERDDLDGEGP